MFKPSCSNHRRKCSHGVKNFQALDQILPTSMRFRLGAEVIFNMDKNGLKQCSFYSPLYSTGGEAIWTRMPGGCSPRTVPRT